MDWRERVFSTILHGARRLRLNRLLRIRKPLHPFTEFFKGLEKVQTVRNIFGEQTDQILRQLKVEFTWMKGYMRVSGEDGHLVISSHYLNHGDRVDVYLDVIHELVHVRQYMEGKELFDRGYRYVERPTEIEAYRYAVEEARNLGLSDERICRYLKTEWMSNDDLRWLAKTLKVNCG